MLFQLSKAIAILSLILLGWLITLTVFPIVRLLPVVSANRLIRVIRTTWYSAALIILQVRVKRVQPAPLAEVPTIWVGNHVSWLDIVLLGACLPVSFVAKSEIGRWPLIGSLARRGGVLLVERGAAQGMSRRMSQRIHQGESLVLFPEGTTTNGLGVAPFHARLFDAAIQANCAINTFTIVYHGHQQYRIPFIGDDDFLPHLWHLLALREIPVTLVLGVSFMPEGQTRKQLAAMTWHTVSTHLKEQQQT